MVSQPKRVSEPPMPRNALPSDLRGIFKRLIRFPDRQCVVMSLGCLETVLFETVQNRRENDQNRPKSPKSAHNVMLQHHCPFRSAWWSGIAHTITGTVLWHWRLYLKKFWVVRERFLTISIKNQHILVISRSHVQRPKSTKSNAPFDRWLWLKLGLTMVSKQR